MCNYQDVDHTAIATQPTYLMRTGQSEHDTCATRQLVQMTRLLQIAKAYAIDCSQTLEYVYHW